jgi:hypothetical protein
MELTFKNPTRNENYKSLSRQAGFRRPACILSAAFACIGIVLYLDAVHLVYYNLRPTTSFWVHMSRQITAEEFPGFSGVYVLRTFLLAVSSVLFTRCLFLFGVRYTRRNNILQTEESFFRANTIFSKRSQNIALTIVTTLCIFFLVLFLTNPVAFNSLCLEDHAVETLSDLLQFANCGLFVLLFFLLCRRNFPNKRLYLSLAASFVFFFCLCGGEEVSWFQRTLDIKTPAAFSSNLQYEMNLHNFATHPLENIYYFTSFAFLVFIPYLKERTGLFKRSGLVSFFTPGSLVMLFSIPFVAYNYLNLNVFAAQLSVGITFFILIDLLRYRYRRREMFTWTMVIFLLFAVTQVLFLVYGDRMVRSFDEKEYKEMLIPLSYLVFSMSLLMKVKTLGTATGFVEKTTGQIRVVRSSVQQEAV